MERIAKRYKDYENKIGDIDEYINNITDNFDGRVAEYTVINSYNNDGNKQIWIDLKPFYDKIGFKYNSDNLISKVEIEEIIKERKTKMGFECGINRVVKLGDCKTVKDFEKIKTYIEWKNNPWNFEEGHYPTFEKYWEAMSGLGKLDGYPNLETVNFMKSMKEKTKI